MIADHILPPDTQAILLLCGYFGGNVRYYDAAGDKDVAATNVRQIGRKTFFQRGAQLIDSTVTADEEKSAKKIERYSREYFDLIERHGKHVAQYLALDEPVAHGVVVPVLAD